METVQPRAVIVGIQLQHDTNFAYSMEELRNLADACDIEVAAELSQKSSRVNPSHYLGTGKIQELALLMEQHEATVAIFNDELSPSQIRNLESALDREVIDRTILILNIFAQRAKTKEAQLQVEVAQLQYMLPRLTGLRESLGRQGGGSGLKNRGAGETKLELDRRRIEERISALQLELQAQVSRRQIQRKQRHKNEVPVVCLVGYTNTGKSSLMNTLVETYHPGSGKGVLAKDPLTLYRPLHSACKSPLAAGGPPVTGGAAGCFRGRTACLVSVPGQLEPQRLPAAGAVRNHAALVHRNAAYAQQAAVQLSLFCRDRRRIHRPAYPQSGLSVSALPLPALLHRPRIDHSRIAVYDLGGGV